VERGWCRGFDRDLVAGRGGLDQVAVASVGGEDVAVRGAIVSPSGSLIAPPVETVVPPSRPEPVVVAALLIEAIRLLALSAM
jgi:hypothetical protein